MDDGDKVAIAFFGMIAVLLSTVALSIAIMLDPRAFTPDFVDRASAGDGVRPTLTILLAPLVIPTVPIALCMLFMKMRWLATSGSMAMIGILSFVWTMACVMPSDSKGEWNPYVRRMEATAPQYEELAKAKSLPPVAAQIRQAAADGLIDRGEAHDILNGRTYFEASSEAFARSQRKIKRDVLTP